MVRSAHTFLVIVIFCGGSLFAQTHKHPVRPIGIVAPSPGVNRADLPEATVKIAGLRAVMLGGNVDGPNGQSTSSYRDYLKRVATVLRARGVTVTEIYQGTSPENIRAAVKGAHFIFYAGHGIGSDSPPDFKGNVSPAGMLVVNEVWSGADDVAKWEPAPGAIVFYLGACFTAGNSSDDMGKIQDAEAKRRVGVYSEPFFKNKFGAYFAAWSDSQAQQVMAQLFAGKTLGVAYDPTGKFKGVFKSAHPLSPENELWYHRDPYSGGTYIYNFAFVGKSGQTLTSLFGGNQPATQTDQPVTQPDQQPQQPQQQTIVDPETAKKYGLRLMTAIYDGKDDDAKQLLAQGADTTVRYEGWTALLLAVYFDRPAVVRSLIASKADLEASMDGWTPLSLARSYERTEIAQILQAAGAKSERSMPTGSVKPPRKNR